MSGTIVPKKPRSTNSPSAADMIASRLSVPRGTRPAIAVWLARLARALVSAEVGLAMWNEYSFRVTVATDFCIDLTTYRDSSRIRATSQVRRAAEDATPRCVADRSLHAGVLLVRQARLSKRLGARRLRHLVRDLRAHDQ